MMRWRPWTRLVNTDIARTEVSMVGRTIDFRRPGPSPPIPAEELTPTNSRFTFMCTPISHMQRERDIHCCRDFTPGWQLSHKHQSCISQPLSPACPSADVARSMRHRHRRHRSRQCRNWHISWTATDFGHPDPPLSPLGSDLLKSFLKSILVPSAIVLLYNVVLTSTSKPTFLPRSLFDYLSYY